MLYLQNTFVSSVHTRLCMFFYHFHKLNFFLLNNILNMFLMKKDQKIYFVLYSIFLLIEKTNRKIKKNIIPNRRII